MRLSQRFGLRRNVTIYVSALGMAFTMLVACAPLQRPDVPPVIASLPDLSSPAVVMDLRVLVIGRHPAAVAQAGDDLRHLGFTVIERDRVQRILDEQDPHLNNPLAAQAYFIRRGGLSGAEVVVLIDVDGPKDAPSVIVKGIDVETGAILWSGGIVSTRETMEEDYNRVVIDLTHRAVMDGFTKPQGSSTAVLFSHP
jgi:hypothetical protein